MKGLFKKKTDALPQDEVKTLSDEEIVEPKADEDADLIEEIAEEDAMVAATIASGDFPANTDKKYEFKDIRYRGPFSHRFLRIMGYLFFASAHAYFMFVLYQAFLGAEILPSWAEVVFIITDVLKSASLPLLFLAILTTIISGSENIKRTLINYSLCSLFVFIVYLLFYERYLVGLVSLFSGTTHSETSMMVTEFFLDSVPQFLNFNIFIDFTICALFFFFVNYTPKIKKKGFVIFFRSLSVIPVLVILGTLAFHYFNEKSGFMIPAEILFLMPSKSPAIHLSFFGLALFIKYRGMLIVKSRGLEYYKAYHKSNRDSFHFSLFCVVMLLVVSTFDYLCSFSTEMQMMGFGDSYLVAFAVPLILLFSYRKPYKKNIFDLFIPLISFALIGLIYIEFFFSMILSALAF